MHPRGTAGEADADSAAPVAFSGADDGVLLRWTTARHAARNVEYVIYRTDGPARPPVRVGVTTSCSTPTRRPRRGREERIGRVARRRALRSGLGGQPHRVMP